MIESWNKELGWKTVNTYEEAEEWQNKTVTWIEVEDTEAELSVQPRTQYRTGYTKTPYVQYSHSYEALVLYIVKRCNEDYPDWTNYTRVAQVFTLALLRYYNQYEKPYTKEKPIKAGKLKQYKGKIGFKHYPEYWYNCFQHIRSRKYTYNNGNEIETATVFWTEIPFEEIKNLVDDTDMMRHLEYAIKKGKYAEGLYKEIRKVYGNTNERFKLGGK